jgi:hypothetical protein
VKEVEEFKGSACLDGKLGSRIQPTSKELVVMGYGPRAAAVLDGDVVDSVGMQNEHSSVAGNRARAKHASVIQLNLEAQRFQ